MPPQLREIGCHVQNHATQWHGFQHEIQLQEIVVAWIKMTHFFKITQEDVVVSGILRHITNLRFMVNRCYF